MINLRTLAGFRQEISPKSQLGKLLIRTANNLRQFSKAKPESVVKKTVDKWIGDKHGFIYGTFTVQPKTNTISFQGGDSNGMRIEYVYGKLTIDHDGVYMPPRAAVALFHGFLCRVNQTYDFVNANFTKVGA